MARTENVQEGGITFGRWKLYPLDTLNWELCEMRDGKWRPCHRYYSWNTFPNALMFAADCELKDGTAEAARDIHAALGEYDRITDALMADMARALGGERK